MNRRAFLASSVALAASPAPTIRHLGSRVVGVVGTRYRAEDIMRVAAERVRQYTNRYLGPPTIEITFHFRDRA